jgi:hypothetical protein
VAVNVDTADDLYGLPLGQFVRSRDALAKRLRAEGRRDDAAAVRRLARPSVAAWVVNQLMRTQRRATAVLFEAGDALLAAQETVLAGKASAADLRTATARERNAVDAVMTHAPGLLDERGRPPSAQTLERVAETLHAVALDPTLRELAQAGHLVDAHRHVGLGMTAGSAIEAAAPPAKKPSAPGRPAAEAPLSTAARALARREAALRDAASAADRAARKAKAARKAAEERCARARHSLDLAEEALTRARTLEGKTAEALRHAQAALR